MLIPSSRHGTRLCLSRESPSAKLKYCDPNLELYEGCSLEFLSSKGLGLDIYGNEQINLKLKIKSFLQKKKEKH